MGRRNKPFFEKVEITGVGAEGNAIAKINDMVVFVKMVAPGDVVDLQVIKKRKRYMEARVTAFHKYSDLRVKPFCKHFGVCGGCKWQHLPYPEQLKFKHQQVIDAMVRIGGLEIPEPHPIMGSENERYYRNKLEFSFSNQKWKTREEIESTEIIEDAPALGFHVPGLFDKIVDIEECWLQEDPSNRIRNTIKDFGVKNGLEFFNPRDQSGLLRNLVIRTGSDSEIMVIMVFRREDEKSRIRLLDHLLEEIPGITSLFYVINEKLNDTLYDQEMVLYHGKDHIIERMEELQFRIGPKSFFQTNSKQSLELYRKAREFAGLTGKEVVYDLYTGTGTIANFVAKKSAHVIGIESVPEAIEDAKVNSALNKITNTRFYSGDIKDVFNDAFIAENGRPDVVITDPPRAGMHQSVVEKLLELRPGKIVYVSCNPATQARDLKILDEAYRIMQIQPVDMFPHTHHVENIVFLELRN